MTNTNRENICPKCGSLMQKHGVGLGDKEFYYYECLNCLYQTAYIKNKNKEK